MTDLPDKMTKEELLAEVKGWRKWWNKIGWYWYIDGTEEGPYHQSQRPPICKTDEESLKCPECHGTYGGHSRRCSKFPGYNGAGRRFLKTLRAYAANEEPRRK